MIDLHFHLLPGIDDGPPDRAETVRLARRAWQFGTHTVAVTPHLFWDGRTNRFDRVREMATETRDLLQEHEVPLRIIPGTEIPTLPQTLDLLGEGRLPTLGDSRTLLLEPPFAGTPPDMPTFIARLLGEGYRLLLAHPERCYTLQEDPDYLREFLPLDMPLQLTARSLTGENGPLPRQTALTLLRSGHPLLIASDAHHSVRRPPDLLPAVEVAARVVGREYARQMVTDLPEALLDDRPLWPPPRPL